MTKKGPSLAKITRPKVSGIVPRMRLFRLLDSGRGKRPATWISGPAGSGKTTLVASYIDVFHVPCLWYEVDEGDCDLAAFFYYMGLAAKTAVPRARKPLPFLTPEYLQGITTFTRRYFENLYSRLRPPFVLVFDSYQNATCDAGLHEAIREGLSIVPEGIHVILISRIGLHPEFARLHANSKINFIGWDELKFTLEETRQFIRGNDVKEVSDEALKALHSRTEGWAAGVILLLEGLENKLPSLASSEKLRREEISHYFAKEIFEKCQDDTQQFLLMTSFLPKITPHMADGLTGGSRARRILSELNRKNYFTQKASGSEVYRYHSLFREFLRERAKQIFVPGDIVEIKVRAANVLESEGLFEDAVILFRDAGEWHQMTRLILAQAPSMVEQGRGQTLTEWIRCLPETVIEQNPFLYYWLGISRMPYGPRESEKFFGKAFQIFSSQGNMEGTFMALSGIFDSIGYGFDNFKPYDQWIPVLSGLYNEHKEKLPDETKAGIFSSMLFAAALRQPNHPDFAMWEEWVLSHYKDIQDGNMKMNILVSLEMYHLFSGELDTALRFIHIHQELTSSIRMTPLALITLMDVEAFYYSFAGDVEKCSKTVCNAFRFAEKEGVHIFDYFLLGYGAGGFLSSEDIDSADAFLHSMSSCLDLPLNWMKSYYHILMTWRSLLLKDFTNALVYAESGLRHAKELGMPQTEAISQLGMALVMHQLNRNEEASAHIGEVHAISRSAIVYQIEFRCLLAEAQFALERGDKNSVQNILRRAMALGRDQGYTNTFFWMPSVMAGLCVEALEAGIEVDYVQDLVRKRNLIPETSPLECENWPWALKVFTLGRFGIVKDGKAVQFQGKIQKRPLSMLKAIIALGGREVSEDRVIDALWPEIEGDLAHESFKATLRRLRKLLGSEKFVLLKDGKVSLDPRYCWVDVWAFERISKKADNADKAGDSDGAAKLFEKALGLCHGSFLSEDLEQPWITSLRNRSRSKFIRSITALGYDYEQAGQCEKAVQWYRKGLEMDALCEEFYRSLMVCYERSGRRAEAIAIYRLCKENLASVLGICPSPQTEAIYRRLKLE